MKEVTLYTQPECPPCKVVKLFLNENKIDYVEKDIKEDAAARDHLIKQLNSYSTPTVTVGETIITGFDLDALKSALEL
ncbi:glutaredoxin family protein [Rossellomorea aquimaris]|uniref:glutaredoxin family protein n=1 Tax=Rossellomorea aquimaris TaxID=189382 RepID=UPI001CD71954|nr:glutaredoxin family protein [Rossellomorea aquimaris]MCA1056613.1 glutaredoxin family protein [Rossellomorea aquimaris]